MRTVHRCSGLILGLTISNVLLTAAMAQSHFTHPNTTPTTWNANSPPLDIANGNVRLRLAYSANAGVRLAEVQALPSGYTFLFETPVVTESDDYFVPHDGIWQARLHAPGDPQDVEYILRPSAANFTIYDNLSQNVNPKEVLLVWDPINVGVNDTYWVEVRLQLWTGDRHVKVDTKMGRPDDGTSGMGIQDVICPLFCVRGPAVPVGNETHIAAQLRSRVLVPITLRQPNGVISANPRCREGSRGFLAANSLLRSWLFDSQHPSGGQLAHPNPGQNMQFSALYSDDDSNRGNMLWVSTLDKDGWFKRLRQTSYESTSHVQYYSWGSVYYPSYLPTEGMNFLDDPYPAAIGAMQATDDAWWYDAAKYYRDVFVPLENIQRASSSSTRRHQGWDQRGVFVNVNNGKNSPQGVYLPSHWSLLNDKIRADSALYSDGAAPNMFVELHQYLTGGTNPDGCTPSCGGTSTSVELLHPDWNPRMFFGIGNTTKADFNKNAFNFLQQCYNDGFNTGVYYNPIVFQPDRIQANPNPGLLLSTYDDLPAIQAFCVPCLNCPPCLTATPYAQGLDYGNAQVPGMMAQMLADMHATVPFLCGSYWDAFGGGGSTLRYGEGVGNSPPYHGNTEWMAGKRTTAINARNDVNSWSGAGRSQDTAFLITEACEEGMHDQFDWQHIGYVPWGNELLLRNPTAENLWFNAPAHARFETSHPFPPLWSAVYHEYSPPQCVISQLSTHCLDSSNGDGEAGAAVQFLSPSELADTRCYAFALAWILGQRVSLYEGLDDEVQNFRMIESSPTQPFWRFRSGLSQTAQSALGPALAFLSQLNATMNSTSLGAGFLNVGRSERPLLPAYDLVNNSNSPSTLRFHPVLFAMNKIGLITNSAPNVRGITSANFAGFSDIYGLLPVPSQDEQVPAVLHSVWSDPSATTRRVGIALANWTNATATFNANFNPALYGLPTSPATYSIVQYAVGQPQPNTIFSGAGSTTLIVSVPARTCWILVAQ